MGKEVQKSHYSAISLAISSFYNVSISIVKTKVIAVLLGPKGLGLIGILNEILNTLTTIGTAGVSNSGVKSLVDSRSLGCPEAMYQSLKRFYGSLALVIGVIAMAMSKTISRIVLGDDSIFIYISVLGIAVVFRVFSNIQNVAITAYNKVHLLVRANIVGSTLVAFLSIVSAYYISLKAVIIIVFLAPFVSWCISFRQSRSLEVVNSSKLHKYSWGLLKPYVRLGAVSFGGVLLENLVGLFSKSMIIKQFGLEIMAYYQISLTLLVMYVGFITSSISSDYYPRLVNKVNSGDEGEITEFINNQIVLSIHLVLPLILIFVGFSNLIIEILYSSSFIQASKILQVASVGTLCRVISWPLVYFFIATNRNKIYMLSELIGNGSHIVFIFLALYFGEIAYLGWAYLLHYILYLFFVVYIYRSKALGVFVKETKYIFFGSLLFISIMSFLSLIHAWDFLKVCLIVICLFTARGTYTSMLKQIIKGRI